MISEQKNIGARLKKIRKRLDLTIKEMANKADVSESFISEIERGLKRPSSIYLYFLSTKLDVNVNWIFSGQGEMFNPKDKKDDKDKIDEVISFLEKLKKKV